MFQFTTTNVINSTEDLSTGLPLWCAKEGLMNIKRIGNFLKDNVTHIYKATALDPIKAKAYLDLSVVTLIPDKHYRLNIYFTLTLGSNNSMYATDNWYKGKPFVIDFVAKDTADNTAKELVKIIKKFNLATQGEKMAKVKYEATNCISIEAVTEYQRFAVLKLECLVEEANHGMGEWKSVLDMETNLTQVKPSEDTPNTVPTLKANEYIQGREGFGTYDFILHNLRIPTNVRTAPFAMNRNEDPIEGAKYTLYTIHYCVNRGTLGNNAVGDQVTSHTTHVFYVREDLLEKVPTGELSENENNEGFEKLNFEAGLKLMWGKDLELAVAKKAESNNGD